MTQPIKLLKPFKPMKPLDVYPTFGTDLNLRLCIHMIQYPML